MAQTPTVQELIVSLRGDRSFGQLSEDSGGLISPPRLAQLARGVDAFKSAMEVPQVRGLARGLHVTERALWLANGASLELDVDEPVSTFITTMPGGTERIAPSRVPGLRAAVIQAIEDSDREAVVARLEAECEALRARIAVLEGGTTP